MNVTGEMSGKQSEINCSKKLKLIARNNNTQLRRYSIGIAGTWYDCPGLCIWVTYSWYKFPSTSSALIDQLKR